jgi:predicted TIM-barrel fold metal-dependent hydrolase
MAVEPDGPQIPSLLQPLHTDEYDAPPPSAEKRAAVAEVRERGETDARRVNRPLADYWSGRLGTAAGLLAVNEAFGERFYEIPDEARVDQAAADAAMGGSQLVIDVQTHYMTDRPSLRETAQIQIGAYKMMSPDWWSGMDDLTFYGLSEFIRCVFIESETAIAVLTSPPANRRGDRYLNNRELAASAEMFERLAGIGRLLNHVVVQPKEPGTYESLEEWRDLYHPAGWKVYTLGAMPYTLDQTWDPASQWWLDDEEHGLPFLRRSRELGIKNICSHKGMSMLSDNGSPRDIGPCASMFPDLDFIVYHSGYEAGDQEGPYSDATADQGVNRLVTTAREHGIGRGGNIYAELGSTWFCVITQPVDAAHVLGKLLLEFGEDNVIWGTDGIWYGPTQPTIDAFRAFQIPDRLCEEFGYPKLTAEIKEKILSGNAARVYGIDVDAARRRIETDDLAWARQAIEEYEASGRVDQ